MPPIRLVSPSVAGRRLFSSKSHFLATPFSRGPAPPLLPKEEQELFEKLQQSSTGAFSTPSSSTHLTTSTTPDSASSLPERPKPQIIKPPQQQHLHKKPNLIQPADDDSGPLPSVAVRVSANGDGEELHPDVRRGAQPEFEGERNPNTGEIGGPKIEPLRWGGEADWSYNGRVTDF